MIDGDDIINIAVETGYRISVCDEKAPKEWKNTFSVHACPNNKWKSYIVSQNGFIKVVDSDPKKKKDVAAISESDNQSSPSSNEVYFQIQFRKFSAIIVDRKSAASLPEAHPITQHWDKMCLIPHRPGEALFLIGVSKTLYYSAFPGECSEQAKSPLTAYVKRRNPGFTYGTPVVEIAHHNSRITSVEVSPRTGHFLATGDEDGYVKVLMLIRPRHLFHTIESRNTEELHFLLKSVNDQQQGIHMHNGPIFSMCWVNEMNTTEHKEVNELKEALGDADDEYKQYLVTGSADRCVKVWEVYWDRGGVNVTQIATLDTLSSHILSLSTTTLINYDQPSDADMQQIYLNSPGKRSQLNQSPQSHVHSHGFQSPNAAASTSDTQFLSPIPPRVTYTQMVVASTNLGTIYVWRVHPYEFQVHPAFSVSVDSGKHLVAIIHSSDTPVVHAVLTLTALKSPQTMPNVRKTIAGKIDKHLLLTTADTSGTVCVHSAPYHITSDTELTTLPADLLSDQEREAQTMLQFCKRTTGGGGEGGLVPPTPSTPSRRFREHTRLMNLNAENEDRGGGFLLSEGDELEDLIMFSVCGQAQYTSPVVSCEFHTEHQQVRRYETPTRKMWPMELVTENHLVDASENPYQRRAVAAPVRGIFGSGEGADIGEEGGKIDMHGHRHLRMNIDTSPTTSPTAGGAVNTMNEEGTCTTLSLVFLNNDKLDVNATALLHSQQERLRDIENINNRTNANTYANANKNPKENADVNENPLRMRSLEVGFPDSDTEDDDDEKEPRRNLPQPSPSLSSPVSLSSAQQNRKQVSMPSASKCKSKTSAQKCHHEESVKNNSTLLQKEKKSVSYDFDHDGSEGQQAVVCDEDDVSTLDEDEMKEINKQQQNQQPQKIASALRTLKNKTLSNTQANTPPPPPPPPIQINIPADSSNGPPSSTVRFAEHHNTYAEVEEKSEDYEQLFQKQAKMNMKYPQSDLSVPGLHSSKPLLDYLKQDQEDYDDCESVVTNSSDRRYLANQAVNCKPDRVTFRNLPTLSDEELLSRLPKKVELRPQVDAKWKLRQQQTLPTEDAMRMSAMRDVDILLQVQLPSSPFFVKSRSGPIDSSSTSSSDSSATTTAKKGVIPTLHVKNNIDTLKMQYTLDMPLDDLFGSLYNTSLARSGQYMTHLDEVMDELDVGVDNLYCGGWM